MVSLSTKEFWDGFWVAIQVLGLPVMQLEYVLVQGLIQDKSTGEGVSLQGVHEHMLLALDLEDELT